MATDRPPLHPQSDPVKRCEQTLWIWQNDRMIKKPITFVPSFYKIYDKLLVNAADNKRRDSAKAIKVTIDVLNIMICVWNNGEFVDVHELTDWYEAIGFSTEFTIETADGYKRSKQAFTNNTVKEYEPTITQCKSIENWTKISFKPDLAKFGMEWLEDDTVALMKRRVVDLAGCLGNGVKVELDGTCVQPKTFEEYVELYLQPPTDTTRIYEKVNDRWEVCICIANGQFEQVSFVNNFATLKGGSHVDYITCQITGYLAKIVNLKPNEIKSYLWVFVNALIDNPAFDSQIKENLTTNKDSFGSTCELTPEFLKKIGESDVVNRLFSYAYSKQNEKLEKRKGKLNIPKLEDAFLAGTAESGDCTLILTEGYSAKSFAMFGLSLLGQDKYGVFPMKSKLLNVREANDKKLQQNAEIQNIKNILGLQYGKSYENVKELRYGHLMIMSDQDHNGSHIKGLLISIFHRLWPSLLKVENFMCMFKTPIVKASDKKTNEMLLFYTKPEYEEWKEQLGNEATKYKIKYYKGLETIESDGAEYYFADLDQHIKGFFWVNDEDGDAIELAFSKKIEARKDWLRAPQAYFDPKEKRMRYLDFINKEFKQYAVADLQRSIPSIVDGLKPGQRKILFCAFKKPIIQTIKVAQFSAYVYEHSAYHHHYGEASIVSTIIGMAQKFVGSNNINLLQPNGQFGTRLMGGKDHASGNCIFTQLSPITRYLFHKDDELILNYLNDNGQSIEPEWFIPIIPMVLVNGSEGKGTECSSFIPNYNPRDVIANLKRLLKGEAMVPMLPWYRGFEGSIQKIASKVTGYTTKGKISEDTTYGFRITELPVKKWTQDYKEFLDAASHFGKDIEGYVARNDHTTVNFKIIMTEDQMKKAREEGILNKFNLTTTLSTTNMHLLDAEGKLKKYDTPEQILEEFFSLRLDFYEKRRSALLGELKKAVLLLKNKIRYIREACSGEILFNKEMDEMCAVLKAKGFKSSTSIERAAVHLGWEETEDEFVTLEEEVAAEGYDYLLTVGFAGVKAKELMKLEEERDAKEKEFDEVTKTTSEALWLKDLDALDVQLAGEYTLSSPKAEEAPKKKAPAKRARFARAAAGPQSEQEDMYAMSDSNEEPKDDNDATEDSVFEDEE